ncbi:hypothetical protein Tco_0803565 [Tanacetum coccineum]|uniref:Uncharacterized protein n=1 Tax=Tanacetum coccineum TaxID=301880 RepID=A0ABQ5A623_9ASTR
MMMPLRILERHTADLIEKYSVLPGPESIKNQESKKSPKEIIRIKKNKTANRNSANYHLYHALMEALIADEDAMDKEVKDRVKDHKRKHDNEGHVSDLEDTDNAHIPKVTAATWFKPIPEDERPATPEPEWTIPPNDFPEPENNWANSYVTTYQVPAKNKLQRKTYDIEDYTFVPKPRAVIYRYINDQRKLIRLNEIYKFSDGTLTRVMEKLDHMVKVFHLFEYNKGMETRKWSEDDKRRSGSAPAPINRPKRTIESRAEEIKHPSETKIFTMKMGNPARATSNQALVGDCAILQESTMCQLESNDGAILRESHLFPGNELDVLNI